MNKILKKIMQILKIATFSLVFLLGLNKISFACDFLSINIGGHKSEIEQYFGTIESDEENAEELNDVTTVSMEIDSFCPNSNLGDSFIHAFIVNDKIAGILIEVLNGTNNEESKKQLLYNYVISNYGKIENSSRPDWTGYTAGEYINSLVKNNSFLNEKENPKECQTIHTSSLNKIFFETLDELDCFQDPFSILK